MLQRLTAFAEMAMSTEQTKGPSGASLTALINKLQVSVRIRVRERVQKCVCGVGVGVGVGVCEVVCICL